MAAQTFLAYVGVYSGVDAALADYQAVHDLHAAGGLLEAYDAAVIERQDNGKVKVVKKHETPTRVGAVGEGAVGLAAACWWCCSRRSPSAAGCSLPPPAAAPRWAPWPATPRRG